MIEPSLEFEQYLSQQFTWSYIVVIKQPDGASRFTLAKQRCSGSSPQPVGKSCSALLDIFHSTSEKTWTGLYIWLAAFCVSIMLFSQRLEKNLKIKVFFTGADPWKLVASLCLGLYRLHFSVPGFSPHVSLVFPQFPIVQQNTLLCNYWQINGIDLNKTSISVFDEVNVQASNISWGSSAAKIVGNGTSQT